MRKIVINENNYNEKIRNLLVFLGLFLIIFSIRSKSWWKVIIGVVFIYFSIYKKKIFITEEGIEYNYKGIFFKHKEEINFSTLSHVTILKSKNEKYLFYFIKSDFAKKMEVEKEYVDSIVNLIESREDKIPIEYVVDK
ncbi:hypothetical protein [Anaerosalibacter massiliensis]|uniref:Bacterial PH domain-containing protein n=1 Tax=Anaerosalibacter massiliensis TaxID=1347392 RepID=A0A9X2S7W2_9FIRM|nr:hypothetical protein [Anaerosalibacter massiliensis]MCR2045182.1 hypothetical protein [Anaerosalibacter massiliensis]